MKKSPWLLVPVLAVATLALAGNAPAGGPDPEPSAVAAAYYLTFGAGRGAEIKGESRVAGREGAIEVQAFSWGVSNSGAAELGARAGAGKATVQDLSITKRLDAASPQLALAALTGAHFSDATLIGIQPNAREPFYTLRMEDVLVTSVALSGAGEVPTESVTLNFAKVTMRHGGGPAVGWDIAKNAPISGR